MEEPKTLSYDWQYGREELFLSLIHILPPSRSDWRTKMLNAVVRFMPSSVNSAAPSEPYMKVSNHTAQAVLNFYLIETSS